MDKNNTGKESKNKINKRFSLSLMIVGPVTLLMLLLSTALYIIGYNRFTKSITEEYTDIAYRTAQTCEAMMDVDKIDDYLEKLDESDPDFQETNKRIQWICDSMGMNVIYVVRPDSTYRKFTSVFNCPGPDSGYTAWELGTIHDISVDEYEDILRGMYEGDVERTTIFRDNNLGDAVPHITSLCRLVGSDGEVKGVMCVQRVMSKLVDERQEYNRKVGLITIIIVLIIFLSISVFIRRQVSEPLEAVRNEAERFVVEETKHTGELAEIKSRVNEINSLSLSIDDMEREIVEYIDNITNITKEKERIGTELQLAGMIQEDSLPNVFPPFPDINEFDIYASMKPAKEIGGDFYDFFLIDDDHLGLAMADVSGKGIPGALFMMVTKILINEHAKAGLTPADLMNLVNLRICEHNKSNMFVTIWFGILDLNTGIITAVNAGHDDPAICKNGGNFELHKVKHGFPVGVRKKIRYNEYEIQLGVGDKIFIYTDGVPEATDINDQMFGVDNMLASLNRSKDKKLKEILESITGEIKGFVGDAIQFDDMTMLCLEFKGR